MFKIAALPRTLLLALLLLAVLGGGSLAGGDLFDDDYQDCPHGTRLREGQIADLTVVRDADAADEVNVAWAGTDPAGWGLGPNAYLTSFVVILNDGTNHTKTLSLNSRKATFDGIQTGREVTVQMAIVTDHADGDYLISDILEQSVHQSLTKPSFSTGWYRITNTGWHPNSPQDVLPIPVGRMYYIGYHKNFANYKYGTASFTVEPATPRLRVGLAHSANKDERDAVDFASYRIRIEDGKGDVVSGGNDAATVESNYGWNKLFIHDKSSTETRFSDKGTITSGGTDTGLAMNSVRLVDGKGNASVAVHDIPSSVFQRLPQRLLTPDGASLVKIGIQGGPSTGFANIGDAYADPPHEHRDFPIDTLSSDETYTITAWAVSDDNEVLSPKATLKVRPSDRTVTLGSDNAAFRNYLNTTQGAGAGVVTSGTVILTNFTVYVD